MPAVNIIGNVQDALNRLTSTNEELNYLHKHINEEAIQPIANAKTSKKATAIRSMLFNLRDDLNRLSIASAELSVCKIVVHEKLVYLAKHYPLNDRDGANRIYCPISRNQVNYYNKYRYDIMLSNGFIYDSEGLNDALRNNNSFPSIPNISEFDVATIQKESKKLTRTMTILSGVVASMLTMAITSVIIAVITPPAIILIPLLVAAAPIGLVVGGITAWGFYKGYNETRSLDIRPTCTTGNTFKGMSAKPSSEIERNEDVTLDSSPSATSTATVSTVNKSQNQQNEQSDTPRYR